MDKYLNEDAITAEIMSYVKNRIYNYAVLIDGDWGTGKTYFIQKSIIPTLEGSGYMPIYISLYGVNSTDTVSQKIALSILTNKLPSDKRTVAKQCLPAIGSFVLPIGQTLLNATGISILEPLFKSPVEDIPWDTIFKKFNDSRKRIFIFDDLERCSLPINEILGYINSLVEHESEKVGPELHRQISRQVQVGVVGDIGHIVALGVRLFPHQNAVFADFAHHQ